MQFRSTNTLLRSPSQRLFDGVAERLRTGHVASGMSYLFRELDGIRASQSPEAWQATVERVAARHELRELIHEDPMTRRAFEKPRGYAGDAGLLDYIYGLRRLDGLSDLGLDLHRFCSGRATIRSVRHRRDVLAHQIDRAADRTGGDARILSLACGHLREGQYSAAASTGFVREIVGLDSDEQSLSVAAEANGAAFTPKHMSVRRLLTGREDLGEFDLVYSAGLYDYLEDRVARRLTRAMFDMLRSGGRLLVCNFLQSTPDVGFMEAFMGWNLIYRDRAAIESLMMELPDELIADVEYREDPFGTVGYLEIQKR